MSSPEESIHSDNSVHSPDSPYMDKYKTSEEIRHSDDTISLLTDGGGEQIRSLHLRSRKKRLARIALSLLPWLLTIIFASLSLALHLHPAKQQPSCPSISHSSPSPGSHGVLTDEPPETGPLGSYEEGFSTDLITNLLIPLEKVRFSGTPHFYQNLTPWLDPADETRPWPENKRYFGPPDRELDENWEVLTEKRYFSISEEEATRAWGDRRHEYVDQKLGGYSAAFDMFHDLHCLNSIRKTFYPDYYDRSKVHSVVHMEHCLDVIRQAIQCYGSTTLIPTKFQYPLRHNYIDSDQEHVCRSFKFLRDYTTSRAKGGSNHVPRNQSLINEEKHRLTLEFHELLPENYVDAAT